jgi:putative tryptophan/tyrosine transport system substrate-binding protein
LRALSYLEGKNITIEYRWAEGDISRLAELANELVARKVDIIVASGTIGAQAAKGATSVIPIVAAGVGDLVEFGLVTSLAHPGGNLTGFVAAFPGTAGRRVQIIKDILPQAKRAAVLWNPGASNAQFEWKAIGEPLTVLKVNITSHEARTFNELEKALIAIPKTYPEFVLVLNDTFMFTYRKLIVGALKRAHLPSICGFREYVDDGGLISYGPSIAETYRRAAGYVDKILKGARPSDLPVDLPTKFELVINLDTAKALDLGIPETLLAIADEVIR